MGTWMFPPGASWERSSPLGWEFSPQTHSIHRDKSSLPWNRDGVENKNCMCFWAGRVQKIHPCFIPIFQSESDLQGFFCQVIPWNSQAHAVLIQLHFGWKCQEHREGTPGPWSTIATGPSQDPSKKCMENPGFGIPQQLQAGFSSL